MMVRRNVVTIFLGDVRASLLAIVSLLLTFSPLLLAQNRPVKFERIGLEQGLSQSVVQCILQDRQGFMWFGMRDGLNKFDGYGSTNSWTRRVE